MDRVILSKDRSTTIEYGDNRYPSTKFDTMSNRSPSDFMFAKSTKHSDYHTSPTKNKVSHNSFNISPSSDFTRLPVKRTNRYNKNTYFKYRSPLPN